MKLRSFSRYFYPVWRLILVFVLVGLAVPGVAAAAGAAGAPGSSELVLLTSPITRSLQPLEALDLQVYAQFYAANGDNLVLLPLEAGQKEQIEQLGFALQVLEAHNPSKKEAYYLVYGLEDELARAKKVTAFIWQEPPQALVRIPKGDVPRLTQAGVQLRPLFLSELVISQPALLARAYRAGATAGPGGARSPGL